ncbi:5-oxoprolinase subunit PxpA [Limibacillus sp. MBR-115]|jgi:UPF0271 protein|uniref:LamB/YcsF family protein n=1 Tax=Limibacillus sp. MBR-115 TaxID=3156465 RepID=UPI003393BF73
MRRIDLNCDMGEGFGPWRMGNDSEMLELVTSANIACGFHAGDPIIMHDVISQARVKAVGVGAHPSFLDIWGFGRRPLPAESPDSVEKMLVYQIGALYAVARGLGHPLGHVKTHGSLGNLAAVSAEHARAVARAIHTVDPKLVFVVLPYTQTERAGDEAGLPLAREIYADRTYEDDGTLSPRSQPGSVIEDAAQATQQTLDMLAAGAIITRSGKQLPTKIDSIGLHGDSPESINLARALRNALADRGIAITSLQEFCAQSGKLS